jgi:hypothetical protein
MTRCPPTPPTGVTVTRTDGTQAPAELAYAGRRFNWRTLAWHYEWIVTTPIHVSDLASMTLGTLPARTDVRLRVITEARP